MLSEELGIKTILPYHEVSLGDEKELVEVPGREELVRLAHHPERGRLHRGHRPAEGAQDLQLSHSVIITFFRKKNTKQHQPFLKA